jgi:hypothetical protein
MPKIHYKSVEEIELIRESSLLVGQKHWAKLLRQLRPVLKLLN